jgi:hypothetical protein
MEMFISHLVHKRGHKRRSRNTGVQTAGYTCYHKVQRYGYTSQYDTLDNEQVEKSENIEAACLDK